MIARLAPALGRWQTWGWVALAASIGYLVYLLVAGLLTPEPPVTPSSTQMMMHEIVNEGANGHSGWHFEAASSEISPDGYTTTYHGVRNATFFRDGRPIYRLRADEVMVDSRNQNYSATGGVHVWSTDKNLPDDLQTDDAYWTTSNQTLTCPTPTKFLYHGTAMRTTHMTVNLQTGASQLGDTSIDYFKASPSPVPIVSAAPITAPAAIVSAAPATSPSATAATPSPVPSP